MTAGQSRERWRGLLLSLSASLLAVAPTAGQQRGEQLPETRPAASQPVSEQAELEEFDDIELLEMEVPVVVTAARREQKITNVPYAVSVITAEDIRRSGARSVPDALRLAPGVDVSDLSYGNYAVSPRGLHGFYSNKTLVLVDGRQVYDCLFGGTIWSGWPLQLEDIERIEIIRGPGGVTWGANAVNGVINIITKDPADQVGLTFAAGGGSRGWHKGHLGYAFADDKLRLRISGEYEANDGFSKGGSPLQPLDDSYKSGRVAVHAVFDAGAHDTLTFSAGSALMDDGFPSSLFATARSQNAGSQANFLLARWGHTIAKHDRIEIIGYVNDFAFDAGTGINDTRYQQLGLQFSHTFRPADTHILTWGLDSRTDLFDATNADPFLLSKSFVSNAVIGLYLQDEWRFAPRWTLNLGGRVDYDFYGGFQPSGRVALSYELSANSTVHGAVSRAFQMPPAALRFVETPLLGGLAFVTVDRDMEPPGLVACELGYRGRFFDRLQTSIDLFWHEYTDYISLRPRPGPPGLFRMNSEDLGSAGLWGIELEAQYSVTANLTLLGNYTFQRLDWRPPGDFSFASDSIYPPEHKCMVGARCSPTDDLHLSGHLYYVDATRAANPTFPLWSQQVDPYFRLDLRAEHEFWNDQASLAVGVRNLLDDNHLEGASASFTDAEVPRMIYAELRLRVK